MKLSPTTLAIISNFAQINQSIFIESGNIIKTKSPVSTTIIAQAKIEEEFPVNFAVYELPKLLNVLNLFEEPDIEFFDNYLVITKNKSEARFIYTRPELVDAITDYSKNVNIPDATIEFNLSAQTFSKIQKASKLFDSEFLNITIKDDKAILSVSNNAISNNSNKFAIELPLDKSDNMYSINIKLSALKFLASDYKVEIGIVERGSKQYAACKFKNITLQDAELEYIVGGEIL